MGFNFVQIFGDFDRGDYALSICHAFVELKFAGQRLYEYVEKYFSTRLIFALFKLPASFNFIEFARQSRNFRLPADLMNGI